MTAFILRRSLQSILVLFVMSLIVFGGVNLVGDPVDMLVNPEADQQEIERVIRDLGLDRPVTEQYWYFLINAFQGDLGKSFVFGEPALKLIVQRMPATFELALFSPVVGVGFSHPDCNVCLVVVETPMRKSNTTSRTQIDPILAALN